MLLLKEDGHVQLLELPDVFDAVQRVPGKTADGLGKDPVNLSFPAVFHHSLKLDPLCSACTGEAFIRIYTGIFPVGIS